MNKGDAFACAFGVLMVTALLLMMVNCTPNWQWHEDAIKHGAARFNPKTGKFEWITTQRAEGK